MIRTLCAGALACALSVSVATAQQSTATSSAVDDALFTEVAACSGMSEVTLSGLGVQKATNSELKKFSQQMVDEHTKMNQKLVDLAAKKRIAVPRVLDNKTKFCYQNLAGLSGEKFDHCYAKAQLAAHMEAVGTFEAEAERGQDPDVKALASEALPKLKEHLRTIKSLAKKYESDKEKEHNTAR